MVSKHHAPLLATQVAQVVQEEPEQAALLPLPLLLLHEAGTVQLPCISENCALISALPVAAQANEVHWE